MKGVFIVGTGRSGTHFTIRLMSGFEDARDPMGGKEHAGILQDVARAAIHHRLPSQSTTQYYRRLVATREGVLLDQHHPNLFFVKHWAAMFTGLVFLYPQRPIYQVVASMLRHRGVMGWYEYARSPQQRTINRIPYPNRFLGVDSLLEIETLPTHLLCARRVIAHRAAFETTSSEVNGALRAANYEDLLSDPYAEFSRIFSPDEMAELGRFTIAEEPKPASLTKYHDVLSDNEVAEIIALEDRLCSGWNTGRLTNSLPS